MSALPEPKSLVKTAAVLLLVGRGSPLAAQRLRGRGFAAQLGMTVADEVVFRRRRRGAVGDQLVAMLPADASTVILESVSLLSAEPIFALMTAARLACGRTLLSAREPWLDGLGSVLPELGAWLAESLRSQRREAARAALVRARSAGAKIGRPRVNLDPDVLLQLARQHGVAGAAERLGCGETTARRKLKAIFELRKQPFAAAPAVEVLQ
jgi:hypothetical protein